MLHTIGRNADLLDQAITSAAAKSTCRRAAGEEANSWAKLLRPTAWFPANDVPDEHTSDGDNSSSGVNDSGAESLGEGDSDSQIEERSEDEACSNDDEEAAESSEEESVFSGDNSNVIETPNVTHQLPDIAKQQNDGAPSDASLLSQYTAHMTEAQVMAAHLPPSARERVHALEGGHGKVHHTISRSEDWIAGLLRCAQMSVNQTDTQKVAEQPQDALPQQIGSDHVQQSPEKLKKDSTFEEMLKQAGELAKPTQGRKLPIKFKDPIGRALNFEWHVCRTWEGMEELITQAFLHIGGDIAQNVYKGHYFLLGPDGQAILPQSWDYMIKPGWTITMRMWEQPVYMPHYGSGRIEMRKE